MAAYRENLEVPQEDRIEALLDALAFYACPESYHAITILSDRPCGEFADDLSDDHGFTEYDRPMPGKMAREVLKKHGYWD